MTVIVIEMPGMPRAKDRPRFTKTGRVYSTSKTEGYEKAIGMIANLAMRGKSPFECAVAARVIANIAIPDGWTMIQRRRAIEGVEMPISTPDLDNYLKAAFDALNGIVYRDDAQIVEISARKQYADKASIRIEITPLGAEVPKLIFRPLRGQRAMIGEVA
jgi:Holliday junction resolvase RusA-like endonuclease